MLKRGQKLADDHNVIRYVPRSKLRRDGDNNVVGFLHTAFELRPTEDSLSVNWLEYYDGNRQYQIDQCVNEFRNGYDVKPSSAFGIGKVENIKGVSKANGKSIRVVYTPSSSESSHSSIQNIPRDDLSLLEMMATEAFSEMVMNADVP